MRILVQKFGGSSVADLECMKKVRTKVLAAREEGYKVVVVLSARAGQTNALLERAYHWSDEPDLAELDVLLTTGEQESVALFTMLMHEAGVKARSVLGFQIPARNTLIPNSLRPLAVSITCSSDSALHGPATTLGRGSVNIPQSYKGMISNFLLAINISVYLIILLILFASWMSFLSASSSASSIAFRKASSMPVYVSIT